YPWRFAGVVSSLHHRSLRDGVRHIIPVHVLAVAVDPRRDDAEAVERCCCRVAMRLAIADFGLAVEGHGDLRGAASPAARLVLQCPIVAGAVGKDVAPASSNAAVLAAAAFGPPDRIEQKSLVARPLNVNAQNAFGDRVVLSIVDAHAVPGVVE